MSRCKNGFKLTDSTNNEDRLAADLVNVQGCRNGGYEHDDTDHASGKERDSIAAETDLLEDCGGVVQYCTAFRSAQATGQ